MKRGAYTLKGPALSPDLEIIATGSEVSLALETAAKLEQDSGIRAKVVSMPCYEVFMKQDEVYRSSVISATLPKVTIEAGRGLGWKDITGGKTLTISIDSFGLSAPFDKAFAHLGFTAEAITEKTCDLLVLGAGVAGMAAALFAVNRGLDVIQVGSVSELNFASGLLDLLAVHPLSPACFWEDPWAALSSLRMADQLSAAPATPPKTPAPTIPDASWPNLSPISKPTNSAWTIRARAASDR